MTLHVPYDRFAATVERIAKAKDAYVEASTRETRITVGDPASGVIIATRLARSVERVRAELEAQGFTVTPGRWASDDDVATTRHQEVHVAAVAYKADGDRPGLWVDAYPAEPTEVEVLRVMHAEFSETGQAREVDFETFIANAHATVVILGPDELSDYANRKSEPAEPILSSEPIRP